MEDNVNRLEFLKLSNQYLHLVETLANELIEHGNRDFIVSNEEIDYELATKWNDSRIAEPFFFNFYHGLELLLKGFLINPQSNHVLTNLVNDFAVSKDNNVLSEVLKKYINENKKLVRPFRSFFEKNKISVDEYHNALRYPMTSNKDKYFYYDTLKQFDDSELSFYKDFKDDIIFLRIEVLKLGNRLWVFIYI